MTETRDQQTDLDRFIALFGSLGVPLTPEVDAASPDQLSVRFDASPSDKVTGYAGFFIHAVFTQSGEFVEIGAWE